MAKNNSSSVYDLNRPVHLARSKVFFEKAGRQFHECAGKSPQKRCVQMINASLYYLQSALEHASLAAKSSKTNPLEDSFIAFLRMLLIHIYSARLLLENEFQLNEHKSPLWQFLHRRGKAQETVKFARSGEQLIEDIAHLFKISREPFDDLWEAIQASMNAEERGRYKLAHDNLHARLTHVYPPSRAERFFQTFWPVHETKNK